MRRCLALLAALSVGLGLAACGQTAKQPEATAAPSYYAAGVQAADSGDWAEAVDAFSRAIEADDDRAAAYLGRGDCYLALSQTEEDQERPDLRGLALRDYEIALALDPVLGGQVYGVYASLAEQALAAGEMDEALRCLHTALATAPDGEAERIRAQAKALTDKILTGSVWYMDGPDSRYYEFFADGTGRIVDGTDMGVLGGLTYENEGFLLSVTADGETAGWTYEPDREGYAASVEAGGEEKSLGLVRTAPRRMYALWQADILGAEVGRRTAAAGETDPGAGYLELYEREYGLLEALTVQAGELRPEADAALAAEQERRAILQTDGSAAAEAFGQLRETVNDLLRRLPDTGVEEGRSVLAEIFSVGEQTLLDYFRTLTDWTLKARMLSVRDGADVTAQWRSIEDVDHCFRDGRLYLRLDGYVLLRTDGGDELVPDEHGRFALETPLLFWDAGVWTEQALSRLTEDSWVGLWDMEYGAEVFFLELDLEEDGTCTDTGGYYPGEPVGRQSGVYTLEDSVLTLTMTAEGYDPGTYRYEAIPLGDSLYMTLLSDGVVYGQSAGSAYVFCGGGYADGVRSRLR